MEIKFLGQSCFQIKGKKVTIVTDPFDPEAVGLKLPRLSAEIVTVSHHHSDHNNFSAISGTPQKSQPFVVDGPGEYEISEVRIIGITSFHDKQQGKNRGKNTIYNIELEGLRITHLGDLGHKLTEEQIEEIGSTDILLIPVGGTYTLGPEEAAEVVSQLSPSIIIPMHYQLPGLKIELLPPEKFLKVLGLENISPLPKLVIKGENLPEEKEVVILNARS